MNVFLKKILGFSLSLFLILVLISYYLISTNTSTYQYLYKYQQQKIKQNTSYSNLLIGDSSLGNAIDSEEFSRLSSQTTINSALTGLYGYAGSYNILKLAHQHHPELKNVILMQTIDLQTKKASMNGYVRTVNSISDFTELEVDDKLQFTKEFISYLRSIPFKIPSKKLNLISNDYIKQNGSFQPDLIQEPFEIKDINAEKSKFLTKIINYCTKHHLNLVYVHGPIYEEKLQASLTYLDTINKSLSKTGVTIAGPPIGIKQNHIGDNEDHVGPHFKKQYTLLYYKMIKNYLVE